MIHSVRSAACRVPADRPKAAVTPNRRHIEWFHDHVRVEDELFDGAADPAGGVLRPPSDVPGHGLTLRPAASRHRVG